MTEKLYYTDSHIHEFKALVKSCATCREGWAVTLDKTAFFPEGGGQAADTGRIGGARVLDVQERDGEILHYTDRALAPGAELACALDWEQRRRRMQNHSGEHVVSGMTHRLFGLNNVGFHMGEECMTIDFDGELSRMQLEQIETLANEAVRDNLEVRAWFPEPGELASLEYRSKLALRENVRIVEIPGVDRCACCAPHVKRTGEIGMIKLLEAERHRGGLRISLACGMDALDIFRRRQESAAAVSALLSAKRDEAAPAVERLLKEQSRLKARAAELGMACARLQAAGFAPRQGNICVFDSVLDEIALRELVNMLAERCSGLAAAFSGDGAGGYRYIIGSRHADLRAAAKKINAGIDGRGGGSPEMIQGRAAASREKIQRFMDTLNV